MIKKLGVMAGIAMLGLVATPIAYANNDCLLRSGCYWDSGDPESGQHGSWVCPNPQIFALCDIG